MKAALVGKDPGAFQVAPPSAANPTALKIDTPDSAPPEDEVH